MHTFSSSYMGKKPGGAGAGAGWLATVRKVFKPGTSKDPRLAKKVHALFMPSWFVSFSASLSW